MGKRHRGDDSAPLSKAELRAHAHAERHRVKGELHALASRVGHSCDVDECDEPAVEWKSTHHLDEHHAQERASHRRVLRHWKTKEWKRRSNLRRQRARLLERHAKFA